MTVVIGTAGHIDHGKTTLLRALTGIDADRLPEERRRGMTIDVGYAHLTLPDGTDLDFVDVPGHDRLVGNMLVGAGEIDAAMLVVAADDGPRAQTIEHLGLLDALAIRHGVAVVTKADITGHGRTAEVVAEVERLLAATSLARSPVLVVSAPDGAGIDALSTALVALRDRVLASDDGAPTAIPGSRLAIDRVFAVKGRGAVVTGTLRGGPLASGAMLRLMPGGRSVRVREVQVHGTTVDAAGPGRTALNLAGVESGEFHRGLVLTDDPAVAATDRILVRLGVPLADRARARVHLGTAAVDASVGRSGRDAIGFEDGAFAAIVRLAAPLAVAAGDRLVLRRTSGADRIVGALVLDAAPSRGISRRRQSAERVGRLAAALESRDPWASAIARLDLHGVLGPGEGAAGPGAASPLARGQVAVAPDIVETVEAAILAAVSATTGGIGTLSDVRAVAARALRHEATIGRTAAATAAAAIVEGLVADGRLVRLRADVGLPGAARSTSVVDAALIAAMDRLERALAVAGPPALADAARAAGCPPDGIRELERRDRIVVLEPDLAYATSAYREIVAGALALASAGPLTPAALRDATGTSRRYVMAILADLDRRGILRRTPDGHVPGPRPTIAALPAPAGLPPAGTGGSTPAGAGGSSPAARDGSSPAAPTPAGTHDR
jgi:selenocysteine-specific elongation factor